VAAAAEKLAHSISRNLYVMCTVDFWNDGGSALLQLSLPGGKRQLGETEAHCAAREFNEEVQGLSTSYDSLRRGTRGILYGGLRSESGSIRPDGKMIFLVGVDAIGVERGDGTAADPSMAAGAAAGTTTAASDGGTAADPSMAAGAAAGTTTAASDGGTAADPSMAAGAAAGTTTAASDGGTAADPPN